MEARKQEVLQIESSVAYDGSLGHVWTVTVRQASPEVNERRAEWLRQKRELYATFVEDHFTFRDLAWSTGSDGKYLRYQPSSGGSYIGDMERWYDGYLRDAAGAVDDRRRRLKFLADRRIAQEISYWERENAVSACKVDGSASLPLLIPRDVDVATRVKILKLNPTWSGEAHRILDFLMISARIESSTMPGQFADLAMVPLGPAGATAYSDARVTIETLIREINSDVFGGRAVIERDVPMGGSEERGYYWWTSGPFHQYSPFGNRFKNVAPNSGNIVLFYSTGEDVGRRGDYLGVFEHGAYDVRVVAQRAGLRFWDTGVDGLVETLRAAINWSKWQIRRVDEDWDGEGDETQAHYREIWSDRGAPEGDFDTFIEDLGRD